MNIPWGRVTWYTKGVTILLFLLVFTFGFFFGMQYRDISRESATDGAGSTASSIVPVPANDAVDVVESTKTSTPTAPKKVDQSTTVANTTTPTPQPTTPTTSAPPVQSPPVVVQTPVPTPTPVQTPPSQPSAPPVPTPASNEIRITAYLTGYGWPDNTPPGGEVSDGVLHESAGGTGTYNDAITLAVGHTITDGKDILDYPAGTKFYIPNLRRYFLVEDTCGDGNKPQNGPCHTGFEGHVWLDLWIGGEGASKSKVLACEDTVTDVHLVIQNPASSYAVTSGPVFNDTCSTQYGDTIVTI